MGGLITYNAYRLGSASSFVLGIGMDLGFMGLLRPFARVLEFRVAGLGFRLSRHWTRLEIANTTRGFGLGLEF